jgi:hypothetical protein
VIHITVITIEVASRRDFDEERRYPRCRHGALRTAVAMVHSIVAGYHFTDVGLSKNTLLKALESGVRRARIDYCGTNYGSILGS